MMIFDDLPSFYVPVNGIHLHVKAGGKGNPLIFLHGFPEFGYSWRHQIPAFIKQYKVIVPDLRGYHKSEKPRGVSAYSLNTLVKDVIALLDGWNIDKACFVGHDWGGALAWTLSALYPERVERLIILNMPHPDIFRKQLFSNFRQLMRSYYAVLFQIPWLPELLFHHQKSWFFHTAFKKRSLKPDAFTETDIQRYKDAFADRKTWNATINYYRAFFRYPIPNPLPRIKPPVGVIWGEKDFALGKELTYNTKQYCDQFLGIRYLPEASHWVQHEFPEEVNGYIREFLAVSL